jgi:hypothetical protein
MTSSSELHLTSPFRCTYARHFVMLSAHRPPIPPSFSLLFLPSSPSLPPLLLSLLSISPSSPSLPPLISHLSLRSFPPSTSDEAVTGAAIGNTNKTKVSEALPLNPRTLEVLSKKEARLLSRYCGILVLTHYMRPH